MAWCTWGTGCSEEGTFRVLRRNTTVTGPTGRPQRRALQRLGRCGVVSVPNTICGCNCWSNKAFTKTKSIVLLLYTSFFFFLLFTYLERIGIYLKYLFVPHAHIVFQVTCIKVLNLSPSKLWTFCLCTFKDVMCFCRRVWPFAIVLSKVIYDS